MLEIQRTILAAHIGVDLHPDNVGDIAMNYVRDVYGEPNAPQDLMLAGELAKRAAVIARALTVALARLPEGQRNSAQLTYEISPREAEVCWLVARGDISLVLSGMVQ